eukprot:gene14558-biopygen21650
MVCCRVLEKASCVTRPKGHGEAPRGRCRVFSWRKPRANNRRKGGGWESGAGQLLKKESLGWGGRLPRNFFTPGKMKKALHIECAMHPLGSAGSLCPPSLGEPCDGDERTACWCIIAKRVGRGGAPLCSTRGDCLRAKAVRGTARTRSPPQSSKCSCRDSIWCGWPGMVGNGSGRTGRLGNILVPERR